MNTKLRRNSLESLNSSSESLEDSDSEEEEDLVTTLLRKQACEVFGEKSKKLFHYEYFHSKLEKSPLCSIPEDTDDLNQATLRQKSTFDPKIHLLKIPIFTKFTFLKSQFSQNSPF